MKSKLKLSLEQLAVDSFNTETATRPSGTVFGEQCTCYTNCTCPGCPTCYASCNGTCDASCNGTCGASCNGTCDAACNTGAASCYGTCAGGCTAYDYTCRNIGTCNPWAGGCADIP